MGRMRAQDKRRVTGISGVDGARVRIVLPGVGYFDTVTEEAFVARDVVGDLGRKRQGRGCGETCVPKSRDAAR